MFRGIYPGLFSTCIDIPEIIFQGRVVWSRNRLEIGVLFKWKNAKENLLGWIVHKQFTVRGISSEYGTVWRELGCGGHIKLDEICTEEFSVRGWGYIS